AARAVIVGPPQLHQQPARAAAHEHVVEARPSRRGLARQAVGDDGEQRTLPGPRRDELRTCAQVDAEAPRGPRAPQPLPRLLAVEGHQVGHLSARLGLDEAHDLTLGYHEGPSRPARNEERRWAVMLAHVLSTTAPGSRAGDDLVDQAFVDGVP